VARDLFLKVEYEDPELLEAYIEERSREFFAIECEECEGVHICAEHLRAFQELSEDVVALALGMARVRINA
jgi:hypothetical protein